MSQIIVDDNTNRNESDEAEAVAMNDENHDNKIQATGVASSTQLAVIGQEKDYSSQIAAVVAASNSSFLPHEIEYNVKKVLNKSFHGGYIRLLLQWENYKISESTWEPMSYITAKELVRQYNEEVEMKNNLTAYVTADEQSVIEITGMIRRREELFFIAKFIDKTMFALPLNFVLKRLPEHLKNFMKKKQKYLPLR